MVKGYSDYGMGRIALGTHLGNFSKEDSEKYVNAIMYALQQGITTIDGAINYRGMCSEKDEGVAINRLIQAGKIKRQDFFISSKAGLLFGDIQEKMNPQKYLSEILEPNGITRDDFAEYDGLYQTLKPEFYEIALNKSLENLGLETLDVHYIHIPEISRFNLPEEIFYHKLETLFKWYENKVKEGKIHYYGLAFEFMVEEPMVEEPKEEKWHIELERVKSLAEKVSEKESHLKYILFEYNMLCSSANTDKTQTIEGEKVTLIEACHRLGFETVGSMPLAMGDGLEKYSLDELLKFALNGMDHVIVGSKNVEHIKEIITLSR